MSKSVKSIPEDAKDTFVAVYIGLRRWNDGSYVDAWRVVSADSLLAEMRAYSKKMISVALPGSKWRLQHTEEGGAFVNVGDFLGMWDDREQVRQWNIESRIADDLRASERENKRKMADGANEWLKGLEPIRALYHSTSSRQKRRLLLALVMEYILHE